MFVSASEARRIESAEAALTAACAEGARASGRPVAMHRLGTGVVVRAGPDSPFSKGIGLGFEPLDDAALAGIEEEHAAHRAPLRLELCTLAPHSPAEALTRRGYALVGFENVLGLDLRGSLAPPPAHVAVTPAAESEGRLWLATVVEGFLHPDVVEGPPPTESFAREALERVFDELAGVKELERFLAREGGAVAGGASLARQGGVALLAGAATLPAHRRRGVQTALLRSRLAYAKSAGCDLAVVTTQPGSVSQANVQRQGFALLYARAILVKA